MAKYICGICGNPVHNWMPIHIHCLIFRFKWILLGLGVFVGVIVVSANIFIPMAPACTAKEQKWTSPIDGMEMDCVPASKFLMGAAANDKDAGPEEKPQHEVNMDAFWIDHTEVTNRQFQKFVDATGYLTDAEKKITSYSYNEDTNWKETSGINWKHPKGPASDLSGRLDYPVVHVTWWDAKYYCEWAKRSLPTEAQWEKAARGTRGQIYPWGNPTPDASLSNFNKNINDAVEVGKYPDGASPYGALDMAGNVWEFVADWYGEQYYLSSPTSNPTGPASGEFRVARGNGWLKEGKFSRSSVRIPVPLAYSSSNLGFRCSVKK